MQEIIVFNKNNTITMKKTNTTAESERLSEIREILFGSNMSEYEKRFQKIEERLVEEAAQLKEETRKQFGILEKYTKNEIELLIAQAKKEQTERQLSIRKLAGQFLQLHPRRPR